MDAWLVLCLLVVNLALMSGQAPPPPPPPPKYPGYPPVEGPKSLNDKIAIIGLTAEGIDMYARLKELGFTYVRIFTKNRYLEPEGVETYYHRDKTTYKPYELGESVIMKYYKHFKEFNDKYAQVPLQPYEEAKVRSTLAGPAKPITQYIEDEVRRIKDDPELTSADIKKELVENLGKYIEIHEAYFGKYDGYVPPFMPPNKTLSLPFPMCLKEHGLEYLPSVFQIIMASQTDKNLMKVPCIYGLMTISPEVARAIQTDISSYSSSKPMLASLFEVSRKGMDYIPREAVDVAVPTKDIRYNRRVIGFEKSATGECCPSYVKTGIEEEIPETISQRCYDFCIVTVDLRYLNFTLYGTEEEQKMFGLIGKLKRYFSFQYVTEIETGASPRLGQMEFFVGNSSVQYCENNDFLVSGTQPSTNSQTSMCFQFRKSSNATAARLDYQNALQQMGYKSLSSTGYIKRQRNYLFTRFSNSRIAGGIYQKIIQMQGKNKMWFAGPGVTCWNVECRLAYNRLLLRLYTVPEEPITTTTTAPAAPIVVPFVPQVANPNWPKK